MDSVFRPTAATYRQGAKTLPGKYYTSEKIFALEKKRIFDSSWHIVGRVENLITPGSTRTIELLNESLILVRDSKGLLHAFFNVCRHRGTQLCEPNDTSVKHAIQCPYHAWTYGLDGTLIAAPFMSEAKNFRKDDYGLHKAAVAEWEGFVFVNLSNNPTPFAKAWKTMIGRLTRFHIAELSVGHRVVYDIEANWKLVFQNYNECLHCPSIHPELSRVLPFDSTENDLSDGSFLGGPILIKPPHKSVTMTGRSCGVFLNTSISDDDKKRAYYYTFMPDMFLSIHPDYCNYYIIQPLAVNRTRIISEWMFHPDTLVAKNNNIQDAIDFWDTTNRQDWDIVQKNFAGMSSSRYVPGPYSPRESIPAAWDKEYLRLLKRG